MLDYIQIQKLSGNMDECQTTGEAGVICGEFSCCDVILGPSFEKSYGKLMIINS